MVADDGRLRQRKRRHLPDTLPTTDDRGRIRWGVDDTAVWQGKNVEMGCDDAWRSPMGNESETGSDGELESGAADHAWFRAVWHALAEAGLDEAAARAALPVNQIEALENQASEWMWRWSRRERRKLERMVSDAQRRITQKVAPNASGSPVSPPGLSTSQR
jgi:hypothetical protein